MARRALISGASIAGRELAYWLHRHGWEPTIVERSPSLREGSQNVDVRGAGREVARRMDIEEAIRAATPGERGTRLVRADGTTVAEFPAATSDTGGATADLEILRGDFARLLYDRTIANTEYVFGDRITALRDEDSSIVASFAAGQDRAFDVVVAADGIGSTTRPLVIGEEARFEPWGSTRRGSPFPAPRKTIGGGAR